MPLITWGPSLCLGIQVIDAQHKHLVDIINRLNDAMAQGKGKSLVGVVLNELVQYTITHFSTEERLMQEHTFSHSPSHQTEHKNFIKQVRQFSAKFEQGTTQISVGILDFLCTWLISHIQESDRLLASELKQKGVQ